MEEAANERLTLGKRRIARGRPSYACFGNH